MVDMDYDMFTEQHEQIMYVGSSRARFKLSMIAHLNKIECESVLNGMNMKKSKNPGKVLATAYNAKYKE